MRDTKDQQSKVMNEYSHQKQEPDNQNPNESETGRDKPQKQSLNDSKKDKKAKVRDPARPGVSGPGRSQSFDSDP